MQRRDVLKTAGGIGAATVATGTGLAAFSGAAAAKNQGQGEGVTKFTEFNPDTEVATDQGTIESLSVSDDLGVRYKGLDDDLVAVVLNYGVLDPGASGPSEGYVNLTPFDGNVGGPNKRIEVADVETMDSRAGSFTWDFGPVDALNADNWDPSDFEDTTNGKGANTTKVTFYCLAVFRFDGARPTFISDTRTVTVVV